MEINAESIVIPKKNPKQTSVDRIQTLTKRDFNSAVLKAQGPIVVEFMSYGCSHCMTLEPVLQEVAQLVASKSKIFRVNVELETELAKNYDVQATPTLLMFLNGKNVGKVEGPNPVVSSVLTAITHPFGWTS